MPSHDTPMGPGIRIRSDQLALTVLPERGALAMSLIHRPSGVELLRQAKSAESLDSAPFTHGIPILFPAGRIAGAQCTVAGHVFRWPVNDSLGPNHLHGFLWKVPWSVTQDMGDAVELSLTPGGQRAVAEGFGAAVDATIRYRVEASRMESVLTIANRSNQVVPFGAGYHTSLALARDWMLSLPTGQEWEMNEQSLPTGRLLDEPRTLVNVDRGLVVSDLVADTCYRPSPDAANVATLWDPASGLQVRMHAAWPFTQWVVYRPGLSADFVSVEPVSWVHNAINLDLPPALTGAAVLAPGEARSLTYTWTVAIA